VARAICFWVPAVRLGQDSHQDDGAILDQWHETLFPVTIDGGTAVARTEELLAELAIDAPERT
jgi:hypothetical protein